MSLNNCLIKKISRVKFDAKRTVYILLTALGLYYKISLQQRGHPAFHVWQRKDKALLISLLES